MQSSPQYPIPFFKEIILSTQGNYPYCNPKLSTGSYFCKANTMHHMPSRHSYDTAVKHLFRLQCQNILAPSISPLFLQIICAMMKNERPDKYTGTGAQSGLLKLQTLQQFAADRNAKGFLSIIPDCSSLADNLS